MSESKNCIEVIKPCVKALGEAGIDYQIFGGVVSAALQDSRTVILPNEKLIVAPADINLPTVRSDKYASKRDLDVLVKTDDGATIDAAQDIMAATVGEDLDPSAFGYMSAESLQAMMSRPLGFKAVLAALSDRFYDPRTNGRTMVTAMFPFAATLNPEVNETWQMQSGDTTMNVLHPASVLLNYSRRSIGGIRPKDRTKIDAIAENVFDKHPELLDWAIDGPGKPQVELTDLIRSLTPDNDHQDYFRLGKPQKLSVAEIAETRLMLIPDEDVRIRRFLADFAMHKASFVRVFESSEEYVAIHQKYFERSLFGDFIFSGRKRQTVAANSDVAAEETSE
jgi:hypothetical protein